MHLVFAFVLGAGLVLLGLFLIPKLMDKFFNNNKKKTFEIIFRIDYYQQPSLFGSDTKGQLVKSPPITVKIQASNETGALNILDNIIKEETKGELVEIKEIKE